jgi:hypothetical protein
MRAVQDHLTGRGLRVLEAHAGAGRILAEGTAAEVNAAFGVTLNTYRTPERVTRGRERPREGRPFGDHVLIGEQLYRGFEGPAHLPAKLVGVVTAVIGLDDRRFGGPAGVGTGDPPGAQFLYPSSTPAAAPPGVAQLYNFPTSTGVGQTVGAATSATLMASRQAIGCWCGRTAILVPLLRPTMSRWSTGIWWRSASSLQSAPHVLPERAAVRDAQNGLRNYRYCYRRRSMTLQANCRRMSRAIFSFGAFVKANAARADPFLKGIAKSVEV